MSKMDEGQGEIGYGIRLHSAKTRARQSSPAARDTHGRPFGGPGTTRDHERGFERGVEIEFEREFERGHGHAHANGSNAGAG